MATTFRASMRTACAALLEGFRTASANDLQVDSARPSSYKIPAAFVGAINEPEIRHDGGTRTRHPRADLFFVFGRSDNEQVATKQDTYVDAFLDYVDANPHQAGGSTLLELIRTEDVDLPVNVANGPPITFVATRMVVEGTIVEGRV